MKEEYLYLNNGLHLFYFFIFCQSIRTVYHVLTSESVSVVCVRAGETQELFVQKKKMKKGLPTLSARTSFIL